tara:strand:+ start:200 stop:457 length:258 start_codon:yes stop_codon:yes gene_type:complete
MRNNLNPKNGRTAATKKAAEFATPDQIAYTLRRLSEQTKRYGACHVPAWLVHRVGLGQIETSLGKYHLGMFGRSLSRFKVSSYKA